MTYKCTIGSLHPDFTTVIPGDMALRELAHISLTLISERCVMPLDVVDVCDDDGVSGENLRKGGSKTSPLFFMLRLD